jgi:serine/threonine-protein kinase
VDASPADPLIGTLIDGRYRVERCVGAGGFGTVYKAFHVGLGSFVALKVLKLPPELRADQIARLCGAFFDEARTLKLLRHPNIAHALDVGLLPSGSLPREPHGMQLPYLVMEWCSGPTLEEYLRARGGSLPIRDAWRIFEPLLDAMAHAHAEGVAHRDLKPSNVLLELVDDAPVPRVVDFGIAKIVAPGEMAGSGSTRTVSGWSPFTPRYAAPEQLAGARTGPWTDVHALALVFFEMLTGRSPFGDDENAAFALFDPARPTLRSVGVDAPDLDRVLTRALALRPADRYADAGALASALRAVASSPLRTLGQGPFVRSDARIPSDAPPPEGALGDPALGDTLAAPERAPTPPERASTLALASTDHVAPPSSHTLRTSSDLRPLHAAPSAETARTKMGAAASRGAVAGVLVLAVGGGLGVQRGRGSWPFARPATAATSVASTPATAIGAPTSGVRLRDLPVAEIDRRLRSAGLGSCTLRDDSYDVHTVACEGSNAQWRRFPEATPPTSVRTNTDAAVWGAQRTYGAGEWAIDGQVTLVLGAPTGVAAKAFDALLEGVVVEARHDPGEAVVPAAPSEGERGALARWNGDDLFGHVIGLGGNISFADTTSKSAYRMVIDQDLERITISLSSGRPKEMLDAYRKSKAMGRFAYAIGGDKLLLVTGAEAHATVEYVRKILDGARAEEVGVAAPTSKTVAKPTP